jgi:arylsulfatase A-like enzyme/tetratricopeptide (TPR) repeat protein
MRAVIVPIVAIAMVALGGCRRQETASSPAGTAAQPTPGPPTSGPLPSILLVTLDTTRADAIGPEANGITTPNFNALAARGRRFRQAYATAPETLPSHSSIMTGLYPAGHGIHENARTLPDTHPVIAERLRQAGYRTAAFVSSFVLTRRFGLARGFDRYDDDLPERGVERGAAQTTDRALALLNETGETSSETNKAPLFVWVHYFDPHAPYAPAEPYRARYAKQPYLGEVAAMDAQLGRLVQAFEQRAPGPIAVIVAADHGEGLGDHGEAQHGHLLYQSTMHVPLVVMGANIAAGVDDTPVSTRRIFHTVLDLAGVPGVADRSLRGAAPEVVLGEAMKPFLEYGWQPQIMAVEGRFKAIQTRQPEVYDVVADPRETKNLSASASLSAALTKSLNDYPIPSPGATAPAAAALDDQARQRLASLGYVSGTSAPVIRKDAPKPAGMTKLLETLDTASTMFVREKYREVIPLLEKILAEDANNLDAALRLATSYSMLGQDARAAAAFARAEQIAPDSVDVRTYLALHYARGKEWQRAVPLLERIVRESPDRLPAAEALATVREKQGALAEAVRLRQQAYARRTPNAAEWVHLGELAMQTQQTEAAIAAFEAARQLQGAAFKHDLELGVLYLAARRFDDARVALDRVPPTHPDYAMALFKRAQVSVLLKEPDQAARIARAKAGADATTRPLIARERLFISGPGQ